jgi:hypothetical protein
MPKVPTLFGELVEHSAASLQAAEAALATHLAKLTPGARKAQETITAIEDIWCGADGTRAMRGPRVLPVRDALVRVAGMMADRRPEVRTQVLITFAAALEDVRPLLDTILLGLDDADANVRIHAARMLERVGRLPRELVPQVRGRLLDPVAQVRWSVIPALVSRVPADELAAALLDSVPALDAHGVAAHAWLRAAHVIEPMPKALAARARQLEDQLASR